MKFNEHPLKFTHSTTSLVLMCLLLVLWLQCKGPSTVESFYEGAYALTYVEIYDYAEVQTYVYDDSADWMQLLNLSQPILTLSKRHQFTLRDGDTNSEVGYSGDWDIYDTGLYARTDDYLITGRMWKSKEVLYLEVHGYPLDTTDKAVHLEGLKIDMTFSEIKSDW